VEMARSNRVFEVGHSSTGIPTQKLDPVGGKGGFTFAPASQFRPWFIEFPFVSSLFTDARYCRERVASRKVCVSLKPYGNDIR